MEVGVCGGLASRRKPKDAAASAVGRGPGAGDGSLHLRLRRLDGRIDTLAIIGHAWICASAGLARGLADAVPEQRDAGIGRECHGIERYSRSDGAPLDGRKARQLASDGLYRWGRDSDLVEIPGARSRRAISNRPRSISVVLRLQPSSASMCVCPSSWVSSVKNPRKNAVTSTAASSITL